MDICSCHYERECLITLLQPLAQKNIDCLPCFYDKAVSLQESNDTLQVMADIQKQRQERTRENSGM